MKISIVMTTYNGEKYIIEQLDSIRKQSKQPDEVIIYDDCSKDNTVTIVSEYIVKNGLGSWSIIINKKNLGWKANFIQAIKSASGDLIFLSDQDDIWKPDKIKVMAKIMEENHGINLLCSNSEILNETSKKIRRNSHLDSINDGSLQKVELDEKFHLVGRPGCTYCLRATFAQKALQAWRQDYAHDKLLWIAGIMTQSLYRLNTAMILYRRHSNNASAKGHQKDKSIRAHYQELDLQTFNDINQIFSDEVNHNMSIDTIKRVLDIYPQWAAKRISNLKRRNISDTLFCIRCFKYYSSILSLMADMF